MSWDDANRWEREWWGNCANTYHEEEKQMVYASCMGLQFVRTPSTPYALDLGGRSVIDIGGGPCSLLLKAINGGRLVVLDPCLFPSWVYFRYSAAHIIGVIDKAEDRPNLGQFDEAWIYNCLQHVEDPAQVIAYARSVAKLVRVFEWVELPVCPGHPHTLEARLLDGWLGGKGRTERLAEHGCFGLAYYGAFPQ